MICPVVVAGDIGVSRSWLICSNAMVNVSGSATGRMPPVMVSVAVPANRIVVPAIFSVLRCTPAVNDP